MKFAQSLDMLTMKSPITTSFQRKLTVLGCDNVEPWWRYQMKTFSTLLDLCEGNPLVTGGFPFQRPVTRCFWCFLCTWTNSSNNRDAGDLRRHFTHCDVILMNNLIMVIIFSQQVATEDDQEFAWIQDLMWEKWGKGIAFLVMYCYRWTS